MIGNSKYGSVANNSRDVGGSGVVGESSLDVALDLYREDVRDYLSDVDFTTTFNELVLRKIGVGDSNIPVEKQLIFLKFSRDFLESGCVSQVQLEEQYFALYVKSMNLSDVKRNERINVLESWVNQCEQKYEGVEVLCMRQEIDSLKNS